MSEETTTDQLAEIKGQGESTPATEYTPPEGWRVLAVGEVLRDGDVIVHTDDAMYATARVGGWVGANQRYIRRIDRKPQPQPQPEAEPVQVREGRWRTRGGDIRNVTPTPECDNRHDRFPWRDTAYDQTWSQDGRYFLDREESPFDLVEYLGPIEPEPRPEPQPNAAAIEELRSEVAHVQNLLGESRQRVTQLEDLVNSLRTINEAQEKSFRLAGQANTDLQHRLNVVSAEWAEQAETIRRLQIELDAAQQVPQAIADRFEEGWNQGTARAVETVLEWLQPIRAVDNEHLANETLQHLPQIMRHLTGLAQD